MNPSLRRRPVVVLRPPTAIFCGAPLENEEYEYEYDEHRPGRVQILPEEWHAPQPVRPKSFGRKQRSSGCGARVHSAVYMCMMPRRNSTQCWYEYTVNNGHGSKDGEKERGVADTVVPLQTRYFTVEMARELNIRDENCEVDPDGVECGCLVRGVGCAVCGNPLGAIQTYCTLHSHSRRGGYVFAPSAVTAAPVPAQTQSRTAAETGTQTQARATSASEPPTWNTEIPLSRSPPTPTATISFPSSPPGYISFIPPTPTPPSLVPRRGSIPSTTAPTTTSFVPPTTTSFVPSTTTGGSIPSASSYPVYPTYYSTPIPTTGTAGAYWDPLPTTATGVRYRSPPPLPPLSDRETEGQRGDTEMEGQRAEVEGGLERLLRRSIEHHSARNRARNRESEGESERQRERPAPRRRRTLRTPESVEAYFGGSTSFASAAAAASASTSTFPSTSSASASEARDPTDAYTTYESPATPTASSSFPADLQRNVMQTFGRGTNVSSSGTGDTGAGSAAPVWGYAPDVGGIIRNRLLDLAGAGAGAADRRATGTDTDPHPWDDAVRWVAAQGDVDTPAPAPDAAATSLFGNPRFAPRPRSREYAHPPSYTPPSDQNEPELAVRRAAAAANVEAVRGYTRSSSSLHLASSSSTPSPSSALSDLERHLDVLGTRAAALDAAAANMRRHVEALRGNPHTNTPTATATAGIGAQQDDPAARFLRAVAVRRDAAQAQGDMGASSSTGAGASSSSLPTPSTAASTPTPEAQAHAARTELLASARAALAGERARLSGMQERLAALGGRVAAAAPGPVSSDALLASAAGPSPGTSTIPAPPPSTIPAPPTTIVTPAPPLSPAIRTLVRDQTALLARVGGLIADMGTRLGVSVGALEGAVRSAGEDAATLSGALGGDGAAAGNAAMLALARARETLARADRTLRRADVDASAVRGQLQGILDAPGEMDVDVDMERGDDGTGDVRRGARAANEEEKRPAVVRRTFFER